MLHGLKSIVHVPDLCQKLLAGVSDPLHNGSHMEGALKAVGSQNTSIARHGSSPMSGIASYLLTKTCLCCTLHGYCSKPWQLQMFLGTA